MHTGEGFRGDIDVPIPDNVIQGWKFGYLSYSNECFEVARIVLGSVSALDIDLNEGLDFGDGVRGVFMSSFFVYEIFSSGPFTRHPVNKYLCIYRPQRRITELVCYGNYLRDNPNEFRIYQLFPIFSGPDKSCHSEIRAVKKDGMNDIPYEKRFDYYMTGYAMACFARVTVDLSPKDMDFWIGKMLLDVFQFKKVVADPFGGEKVKEMRFIKFLKSSSKPRLFTFVDNNGNGKNVLYKCGDDLRKDIFCLALIEVMNQIWIDKNIAFPRGYETHQAFRFAIHHPTYKIVLLDKGNNHGLIELVRGESVQGKWDRNLMCFGWNDTSCDYPLSSEFFSSVIGTFVAGYVLGLRDRHQDNLFINSDGLMLNIDFGFIFGDSTWFDTSDFAIPFGLKSAIERCNLLEDFNESCYDAFCALRDEREFIISSAHVLAEHLEINAYHLKKLSYLGHSLCNKINKEVFIEKVKTGRLRALPKIISYNVHRNVNKFVCHLCSYSRYCIAIFVLILYYYLY